MLPIFTFALVHTLNNTLIQEGDVPSSNNHYTHGLRLKCGGQSPHLEDSIIDPVKGSDEGIKPLLVNTLDHL